MYRHERVNQIVGWSLAAVALIVYLMTTAPVVAFWDNGEFIAVGVTLGVGHPPGSPVYTLLSRLFALLPFPNAARAVNFESIVAATLAIAFLYFSLARMARRWEGRISSFAEGLPTYVAGVTACLFTAFSFSFWENALEAEVYATNIFVMAVTLWLTLRWSEQKMLPRERHNLFLVIYLLALGIGVHMGCLLWAPAFLLFVIFFERKYLGIIFLAFPLALGFVLASKGYMRGAFGLWLFWLAVTIFYAVPRLWPKREPPRKKAKAPAGHPAVMPAWLTIALAAIEIIVLFATASAYGGRAAGWFLGCAAASAASVYVFVRLLAAGMIEQPEIPARMVLGAILLGLLALSVHAYLLIRARLNPAINESDPNTWGLVFDVIRRKQYEPMRFFPRRTPFGNQLAILWSYYRPQFMVLPLVLAAWGAVAHARKDRRTFAMMLTANLIASFGLLFYMNISDHEVRSREYFWVPSYVGLALWMGIGSGAIVDWAKKLGPLYRNALAVGLVVFSLYPFVTHYRTMDRSGNYVAYYYGWNMMNFLEPDAILITNGDNDTFPLWYLQEVEGIRKDVEVVNLSLLQINWYVKQLKDRGLPMSFTYNEIEQMHPYWTRDPQTGEPKMITLKDIVLHDMIRENRFQRPVYFAVTVEDFAGYYDNLSLEGMVFKLVPETERHQVDAERTWKNVYENYRYDSIVDKQDGWRVMDEVYKTPDTRRLITNYAAGFSRLGFKAMQESPPRVDEALNHYSLGLRFAPEYGPALNGLVAIYAVSLRQPETALPFAETLVKTQPGIDDSWIRFGGVHLMIGERLDEDGRTEEATPHYEEALEAYEVVLKRAPEKPEIYPPLLAIYRRLNREQELNELLELWQRYAPDDFQRALEYGRTRGGGQ